MNVKRISIFNFKSESATGISKEISNPFLFHANENYKAKFKFREHKTEYFAGVLSLILAATMFTKFLGRNTIPKNVIEIMDKNLGLNKIKGAQRTVKELKEKILYPIKCLAMGEKRVLKNDFKTGLITISDKDSLKAKEINQALLEHARELGIKTVTVNSNAKNRLKAVYQAIDTAEKFYEHSKEFVIVNLGDLSKFDKLTVSKVSSEANIEKRLAEIKRGVLWISWTNEGQKIPYFYNNVPALLSKVMD